MSSRLIDKGCFVFLRSVDRVRFRLVEIGASYILGGLFRNRRSMDVVGLVADIALYFWGRLFQNYQSMDVVRAHPHLHHFAPHDPHPFVSFCICILAIGVQFLAKKKCNRL